MTQSQFLKIPNPIHRQMKALAEARGCSMVAIVHRAVTEAIQSGEIPDELPGFKVSLLLDLDAADHGPFVHVSTPSGDFPRMTRDDAEAVVQNIRDVTPRNGNAVCSQSVKGGHIDVGYVGVGIEIEGTATGSKPVRVVLSFALAREFARQIERHAKSADSL